MRNYIPRRPAEDRRKPALRHPAAFERQTERRTSDVQDRRLSAQTERIGSSLIFVTYFD